MKAVVVNPEGTGVEIVAKKQGKLLFKSNTVVSATLTCTLLTETSVKFQAVFLDTKESELLKNLLQMLRA